MESVPTRVISERDNDRSLRSGRIDPSCSDTDQDRQESRAAVLEILTTASWLTTQNSSAVAPYQITSAQYNVLSILNDVHPEPMTCTTIGCRLLDRTPDVTRLLNRLEKAGYIRRTRCSEDRRIVEVFITDSGRDLVRRLEPEVTGFEDVLEKRLSPPEFQILTELLHRIRRPIR